MKKMMYSTQMSPSFQSELEKRKINLAKFDKPFKINCRLPYFSNHEVARLQDRNSEILLKEVERKI